MGHEEAFLENFEEMNQDYAEESEDLNFETDSN
jgi:hypothetical protein